MKLTLNQIIIIAVTATLSFPVIYFLLLFTTGQARIEFNRPKNNEKKEQSVKLIKSNPKKDSLAAAQSQTFMALEHQKTEIEREKHLLAEQQDHLKIVEQETEKNRNDLSTEREKLEKLVSKSDDIDKKRIRQLAKVYGAMRAEEAARILETLDDDMCISILTLIGDDRQKAKILAALSGDKASRVSRKISTPLRTKPPVQE
jgi:flagellar motility protein MotE (MotC chaperone)